MAIKKTIKFNISSKTLPPTSSSHVELPRNYSVHPPIGQKPEGDIDLEGALDRLGETIQGLMKNMENKRLKDALCIVESPLVLTEDMEVKDGHK
jgi:hypothetical protein